MADNGKRRRGGMHWALPVAGVVFWLYLGAYVGLSRAGYALADRHGLEGFYYFAPEDSAAWRFRNGACTLLFWPVNQFDRRIGLGRAPACEPLWDIE